MCNIVEKWGEQDWPAENREMYQNVITGSILGTSYRISCDTWWKSLNCQQLQFWWFCKSKTCHYFRFRVLVEIYSEYVNHGCVIQLTNEKIRIGQLKTEKFTKTWFLNRCWGHHIGFHVILSENHSTANNDHIGDFANRKHAIISVSEFWC